MTGRIPGQLTRDERAVLVSISGAGQVLWSKQLGNEYLDTVYPLSDTTFLAVGRTGIDNYDVLEIRKMNQAGEIRWRFVSDTLASIYGFVDYWRTWRVALDSDGTIRILATLRHNTLGDHLVLLSVDMDGKRLIGHSGWGVRPPTRLIRLEGGLWAALYGTGVWNCIRLGGCPGWFGASVKLLE